MLRHDVNHQVTAIGASDDGGVEALDANESYAIDMDAFLRGVQVTPLGPAPYITPLPNPLPSALHTHTFTYMCILIDPLF